MGREGGTSVERWRQIERQCGDERDSVEIGRNGDKVCVGDTERQCKGRETQLMDGEMERQFGGGERQY